MAAPKKYGSQVALHLPAELNQSIRAAAAATGKTLSDVIRESLQIIWGKDGAKGKDLAESLPQAATA